MSRELYDRVAAVIRTEPWALRTERLELTPIRAEHAPRLFDVLAEPALYLYTGGSPPATLEVLTRGFANWESRLSPDGSELWLTWMTAQRDSGAAVGYVQATVADNRADLAWVIGLPWQGRGYASEASRAVLDWLVSLGAVRFRACVKPAHRKSQQVAERLGLIRTDQWIAGEEVWVLDLSRR